MSVPCPNSPGCQHSAFFHEANVLSRQVECKAADIVVDDPHKPYTEQIYTQVPCRCGTDPLAEAREIMKQQAREAGRLIIERWHNHTSRAYCHPSRCPAGGTDWDGRGLVSDHFTSHES